MKSNTLSNYAKKSEENPDEYIIKGFVEGYVDCKKPIKSKIDRKTDLVYSYYVRSDIYSNDTWTDYFSMPKTDKSEI